MNSILVIGSSNTDMVVKTTHFPTPGQTVLGGQFFMFPGGKGANQAVAAAKLGGRVSFITKLGKDIFGEQSLAGFQQTGMDTRFILQDEFTSTGVALITVNEKGENHIVVAPGANHSLTPDDLDKSELAFMQSEWILMQLEIPVETIVHTAGKAQKLGKKIVLNPAPAMALPEELFSKIFLFTPNETEAGFYTGVKIKDMDSARKAAAVLLEKGVANVVITMGSKGAYFTNASVELLISTPAVNAVDTTAAGDVFNGALCVALADGMTWKEALTWACKAAAFSVTRMGAQSSTPTRAELDRFNP